MSRILLATLLIALGARAEDRKVEAVRIAAPPASVAEDKTAQAAISPSVGMTPRTAAAAFDQKRDEQPSSFHVGAMMGLVSLPRPLDVEIYARLSDWFFIGFSYSDFSAFVADPLLSAAGVKSGPTTVRLDRFDSFDAELRVFPFAGSFFLGSSFGRQSLKAAVTQSTAAGPQSGTLDLATIYATPRLGYLWTFGPGFVLGLDVGAQLKLSADRKVTLPPGASQDMQDNVNTLVDAGSSYPLPSFHLRLGWQY